MSDILLSREDQLALQIVEDLNKPRGDGIKVGLTSRLHPDQIEQLRPLYSGSVKSLFLSCGRKWGKSELVGYILWRHALENPGSACYYIGPEAAHARKIMWDKMRFQRFLGSDTPKYIDTIRNQEMMVRLKNGSFIQVVGSDNYAVANGLTPDIAVYDEFKAFNPRWHVEFAPNRAAKAAPLVIIGTKPRAGNSNMEQYNEILDFAKKNPHRWYVAERTTFDNPINHLPEQKEIIEEEIEQLIARGEEDVVQLEYFSKVVPGGKRAIFPMFTRERHVRPHNELIAEIKRDIPKMEWYCIADPGSTTCFATLFIAVHPYSRKVYVLDELYETTQENTSTRKMYPRMDSKMMELYPNSSVEDDWYKVHDEAAAWFATEVMDQYFVYFASTQKHMNKKEHGLSLIKDLMLHDMIVFSDRCLKLFWEIEMYAKDDKGNIPKKNDHLIDCLRYFLGAANYNMHEVMEIRKKENDFERGRFRNFSQDRFEDPEDWTQDIFPF